MKKNKKIKIILNGKSRSLQKITSVYDLMRSLKLSTDKVAIELNKEIVNKMIVMLRTQPKANILKIQNEINRKLENNIELNWGEKITHIAVKEILKQKK